MSRPKRWLSGERRLLLGFALAIIALFAVAVMAESVGAEGDWHAIGASTYGPASQWDCGQVRNGQCAGYWDHITAWGAHCDPTATRGWRDQLDNPEAASPWAYLIRGRSVGVAHLYLPLGSWIQLRKVRPDGTRTPAIYVPVTDRGPYASWGYAGGVDLQEPLVEQMGWREIVGRYEMREAPELARYCPRLGYPSGVQPVLQWSPTYDVEW